MRRLLAPLIASGAITALAGPLTSTASAFGPCGPATAWQSAVGYYVTADYIGSPPYEGMLRARSPEVGPWQIFIGCKTDAGHLAIWSEANGLWVTRYPGNALYAASGCVCSPDQEFEDLNYNTDYVLNASVENATGGAFGLTTAAYGSSGPGWSQLYVPWSTGFSEWDTWYTGWLFYATG